MPEPFHKNKMWQRAGGRGNAGPADNEERTMKQHKKLLALLAFTICLAFGAAALYTPDVYAVPAEPETRDEASKEPSASADSSSSIPAQTSEDVSTQAPKPEPKPESNPKPASEAQTQAPPKEETQTPAQTTGQNKPGAVSSAPRASAINAASAAGTSSFARSEDPSALSSLQSEAPSEASSGIRLPSVAEVSGAGVLSAPVSDDDNDQINWLGIISWVCIGIGILIVVVVILSNRRPPRSGYGRTRYKRQKSRRRGRKARLLNDKYYRRL